MENSTKALIIGASILIAIVLISVSIKLLSSTSEVTNQVDSVSTSMAASIFNSQFTSFFSPSATSAEAKELISKVMTHNFNVNSSNTFSKEKHQIYINLKKADGNYLNPSGVTGGHKFKKDDLLVFLNAISSSKKYNIQPTVGCGVEGSVGGYYNGYILCITIQEKN